MVHCLLLRSVDRLVRSPEPHDLGRQPEQRLERVRRELAREQVADASPGAVVEAPPAAFLPDLPDPLLRHLVRAVGVRVPVDGPLPVRVRERAVGVAAAPPQQAHQRRQVVLVDEALPPPHAKVAERREAGAVRDGLQRQRAVHLEPLRALAPPRQRDVAGGEEGPVARPAAAVLVAVHEAGVGAGQEGVHGGEVVHRDARLGEEREPLVAQVQERVCQEPPLRLHQARVAPFLYLRAIAMQ
uniref:Uncharacterized protein n=1 Tax=Zea mays TaxID=4577 RepID=B6TLV9_MAIZE|nr:hypothetical protein [Zea mays]